MRDRTVCIGILLALLLLTGCSAGKSAPEPAAPTPAAQEASEEQTTQASTPPPTQAPTEPATEPVTEPLTQPPTEAVTEPSTEPTQRQSIVCIDPGHQSHGNSDKEPNGPGSSKMKAKVTGGARGVSTGRYEYELNLEVSLKLRDELESRGYQVVMVRTENDVDISNVERSQVANDAGADAFVRIHANGSESSSARGAMTICMTPSNPYNSELYLRSRALSDAVLDALVEETGCRREYVWETDTMTGINWCQVPVTIVEMGYLSNPEEDRLLFDADYQQKIVTGIANGLDNYFTQFPSEPAQQPES